MTDPIIRANQRRQAYLEEGGIKEYFETMRLSYFERAGHLDGLTEAQKATALYELSLATRITRMVEDNFRAAIDDLIGKQA
jgi:hypothetical protein